MDPQWGCVLWITLSLVGAIAALLCGREGAYRRALGCSPRAAMGVSLVGLALGATAGAIAGVVVGGTFAPSSCAALWVVALVGCAVAAAADAASAAWWSRTRGTEQPGFAALVAAVVGWWLLAAVAMASALFFAALLLSWETVAIGYP